MNVSILNICLFVIEVLVLLKNILFLPLVRLFSLRPRKYCPPITNSLLLYTANQLAHMIRTRQVKCEQVIKAYIARVQEVNPIVNAVVQDRFDLALKEAKEVDKYLESTNKTEDEIRNETPLLGIPITVKESIAVEGMSNNAGVMQEQICKVTKDAEIVRLCKKAGGIPILVSNTPEFCMFWETYNNVTGRTLNPYDTRRTPGGSSGGEAALLGSGASLIGLGSDVSGSLRLPAMFTGIFGHKPTPRITSREGHNPTGHDTYWDDYFVTGPFTRYAEDLPLILSVITKPEAQCSVRFYEPADIKSLKYYVIEDKRNSWLTNSVDKEINDALNRFIQYLQDVHNIETEKVEIKNLEISIILCATILPQTEDKFSSFYDPVYNKFVLWRNLLQFLTFRSTITCPMMLYGILKSTCSNMPKKMEQEQLAAKIKKDFQDILSDNGVIFYPTYTNAAHYHNEAFFKLLDTRYMSVMNMCGFPVTNCPMGFNSQGLPIGIQVVSNSYNDRFTIAVAQEMEKFFGGWKPPCKIEQNK